MIWEMGAPNYTLCPRREVIYMESIEAFEAAIREVVQLWAAFAEDESEED